MLEDVTAPVSPLIGGIEQQVQEMARTLSLAECPEIGIGPHCDEPYQCPLHEQCWSFLPEDSVFTLYRGGSRGFKLMADGITHLNDIPSDFALTDKQRIQRRAVLTGKPHVEQAAVAAFARKLKYPISFLDFETLATAIPFFDGVRPFQQVPFQFSLHIQQAPGAEPEHHLFLADGPDDPRPGFMASLRSVLSDRGSVVAYNADFEIIRLAECADALPEFRGWIKGIEHRVVDLLKPFQSSDYHHHQARRGSCSMKATLPALTGSGYLDPWIISVDRSAPSKSATGSGQPKVPPLP